VDDPEAQARQCLENIDLILREAGATVADIAKIGVFVTDITHRSAVARARSDYFGDHRPASTMFAVSALVSPEFLVEIEATVVF
jgi:enamine deaminase RidA (YjgF/YER057c/UK114 family)